MEKDIQDKSRTQIKKEAEKLQKLGEQLIKLPIRQLERMELPDDLRDALIEARSIKSKIAGRRQRQFIGTLMRDVDPEPIRHALLQTDSDLPIESEIVKKTRRWLDRLLTDDPAVMEEFICACPGLDRQRLRQLMRNAKNEKITGKSSKSLKKLEQLIMKSMSDK
ncbi:ribosome biogenesis factor YjgA [Desulfobacula phenolica]|uniref:Ribosome-associated protein n=1 Tax=Desulfobacula phenolica TaxID=90732 RepID=A0A1H2IRR1_9BACT|nr:ribosome biogenesis factor YjgA [Desulfobacula phenolica]SDU46783.1 ribosome-associated protein [Desulfobacula phenolica]